MQISEYLVCFQDDRAFCETVVIMPDRARILDSRIVNGGVLVRVIQDHKERFAERVFSRFVGRPHCIDVGDEPGDFVCCDGESAIFERWK